MMANAALETPASATTSAVKSPIKLAHIVFRTSRFDAMIAWYKKVLNATTAFANDEIAFIAYDDEHHRVAFIHIPGLAEQPAGIAGLHHVAFTFDSLDTLFGNYQRLREEGIEAAWPVNHGPTTSLYYSDPDGNQVEFQVDNYDTVEEAGEYFFTEEFATNTIGVDFDVDALHARLEAGEDERKLKLRPPSGPRGVDTIPLR